MSKRTEYAEKCFNSYNCSQAVFTAFCEDLGLDVETGFKVACAFGGGMSHTDEVCGAVSGALLAIGLKYGKFRPNDQAAKDKTYQLSQEFIRRFKAEFGSAHCTDLIHANLSDPDEAGRARGSGNFKTICPTLIKRAVEITEDLI